MILLNVGYRQNEKMDFNDEIE